MTVTLDDFCRELLDDHTQGKRLDAETIAAAFVACFRVSARPGLEELTGLMSRAGFGDVSEMRLDQGLKGVHFGMPGRSYDIYYKQALWQGAKEHTVLHEAYEIIHETLCELHSGTRPEREVCRQADRFAAAVLMQPEGFALLAEASGLDVTALQREYVCSYSSVTLRLAEVLRTPPLMAVLYEREEDGDPADWPGKTALDALRAKVVKRTAGLGPPRSRLISGSRGGIPRKDKPLPSGSLAERAARSGGPEYAEGDGLAVAARPVLWKGRLAKVAVVAVPYQDRTALAPA